MRTILHPRDMGIKEMSEHIIDSPGTEGRGQPDRAACESSAQVPVESDANMPFRLLSSPPAPPSCQLPGTAQFSQPSSTSMAWFPLCLPPAGPSALQP